MKGQPVPAASNLIHLRPVPPIFLRIEKKSMREKRQT
jgi:hypothetical protein